MECCVACEIYEVLVNKALDVNKYKINSSNLYVLAISFDIKTIQASDFLKLILSLIDCGVIYYIGYV